MPKPRKQPRQAAAQPLPPLNPLRLLPLGVALKLLPGVKPVAARNRLKGWLEELQEAVVAQNQKPKRKPRITLVTHGSLTLTLESFDQLMVDDGLGKLRVTPAGAKILIDLYGARLLPMHKSWDWRFPETLSHYAFEGEARMRAAMEDEVAARRLRQEMIENPRRLTEADFEYRLLNDIFFHHIGPGPGTLWIGEREVHKSIARYTSNSGKSADWSVAFSWIDREGERQTISRESRYSRNRRSDPARNWGLPE